jgi:hypothetical protein
MNARERSNEPTSSGIISLPPLSTQHRGSPAKRCPRPSCRSGAQGGTAARRTGAAPSFVSCIRLFGAAARVAPTQLYCDGATLHWPPERSATMLKIGASSTTATYARKPCSSGCGY